MNQSVAHYVEGLPTLGFVDMNFTSRIKEWDALNAQMAEEGLPKYEWKSQCYKDYKWLMKYKKECDNLISVGIKVPSLIKCIKMTKSLIHGFKSWKFSRNLNLGDVQKVIIDTMQAYDRIPWEEKYVMDDHRNFVLKMGETLDYIQDTLDKAQQYV